MLGHVCTEQHLESFGKFQSIELARPILIDQGEPLVDHGGVFGGERHHVGCLAMRTEPGVTVPTEHRLGVLGLQNSGGVGGVLATWLSGIGCVRLGYLPQRRHCVYFLQNVLV